MEKSFYEKYNLKRVINASGRMSILGVSAPSESVLDAMKTGGKNYFEMADLVVKAGKFIADTLSAEDALIVNSASSGIALAVAGIITDGDMRKSEKLHQIPIDKNEIILFKGHNVQYGAPIETMISLGGGQPIEVGYANEGKASHLASAINANTAAILFVQSHHAVQKNMIDVKEAWKLAKSYKIPLIVDAAAEADMKKFIKFADLVIFSGSKALEGPTSGIVAGKANHVKTVRMQQNYIGRSMKVGKEAIFGLLQAIEEFNLKQVDKSLEQRKVESFLQLNEIPGLKIIIVEDSAGRDIQRARVYVDEKLTQLNAENLTKGLKSGNTAVYTRDYGVKQGFFDIDVRSITEEDAIFIIQKIQEFLQGGK